MKINSELGYEPITYSEITQDEKFWEGCKSCVNYDILISKNRKNCLCTAMMYDKNNDVLQKRQKEEKILVKERLNRMKKKHSLLKIISLKLKRKSKTFFKNN